MTQLALIKGAQIRRVFPASLGRLDIPGKGQVSPPVDGWEGLGHRIAAVQPFSVPEGHRAVGAPSYALFDGEPVESYETEPASDPVPGEISDRQFFQQLAIEEEITEEEALAAVKTGEIPLAMELLIDNLPAGEQFGARMMLSGATSFERHHPLTLIVGQLYGWDEERLDAFWLSAAVL